MASISANRMWMSLLGAGALLILPFIAMAGDSTEELVNRYIEIQGRHPDILKGPGVTGMGVGRSETDPTKIVIRVYVQRGASEQRKRSLPTDLEGAPVEVIERDTPVSQ
jgi:hypothetical protein